MGKLCLLKSLSINIECPGKKLINFSYRRNYGIKKALLDCLNKTFETCAIGHLNFGHINFTPG